MDRINEERTEAQDSERTYEAPAVTDYGSLQEITAGQGSGPITDVPVHSKGPNVFC